MKCHEQMSSNLGERDPNYQKKDSKMFEIFEQAKKLCKMEQHQNGDEKRSTLRKLEKIQSEIIHFLNQPYIILCNQFVGALCILVYITRTSKENPKTKNSLHKQFYSNLPDVLADAYFSYSKKRQASLTEEKGTTLSTLIRILLEIHNNNHRLQKKIFSPQMINFILQIKLAQAGDLLRQIIKLKIRAINYASFEQKKTLSHSLLTIFQSNSCDNATAEKILETVQHTLSIEQIPKEKARTLIRFLKLKVLGPAQPDTEGRPMTWFYTKYIYLCKEESFTPSDFPELLEKFRFSGGLQKKLLKSILENFEFKQSKEHLGLVKKFISAKGSENQIYLNLLIKNFLFFDSGVCLALTNTGFANKISYILFQQQFSQPVKSLAKELAQKMQNRLMEVNSAVGWVMQKNLQLISKQEIKHTNVRESNHSQFQFHLS